MVDRGRQNRSRGRPLPGRHLSSFNFSAQWSWGLIFIFCAVAPLVFFSGFDSQGQLSFTLYDFPKVYFIAAFSLLLVGLYFISLWFQPDSARAEEAMHDCFCLQAVEGAFYDRRQT